VFVEGIMKIADISTGLMGPTLERDCAESEDMSEVLITELGKRGEHLRHTVEKGS
jgi:hypothetical protein